MDISDRATISLENRKISVLGLGLSGKAAAQLAKFLGAEVLVSDPADTPDVQRRRLELEDDGIYVETGGHTEAVYDAELLVVSPGIPQDSSLVLKALQKGIPVVGEIEFASWFTNAPILAITGSNGKTTTSYLLAQMCRTESVHGILAGNVGTAFSGVVLADLVNPDPKRVFVLEISSFQMEFIRHFKPAISIFLNITPDHLDRYKSMEEYIQAKINMIRNLGPEDTIIYNSDDSILTSRLKDSAARKLTFSLNSGPNQVFSVTDSAIVNTAGIPLIKRKDIALPGPHNLANILAAASAAGTFGIPDDRIREICRTFQGVHHRLETVAVINGVRYINDSKATNVDAVIVALQSFTEPLILILGGKDKGGDFKQLLPHTHNTKAVLAYGQARTLIAAALQDAVRLSAIDSLKGAVVLSHQLASPGDIVLLSPGCASFDQFRNFEERGEMFKQWVLESGMQV